MGFPKALLSTQDGVPFVVAVADALTKARLGQTFVVTGREHERISAALAEARFAAPVSVVRNPDPARGQLSSLLAAMDVAVTPDTEALMVTLVDVPLLTVATVQRVAAEWRRTRAPIVRPAIGDRHGHPVIFDRRLFDELRAAPLDAGAKVVVRAHAAELLNVPVTDEGCLVDIDTPGDYRSAIGR
jgi:molybdenum cofactor cytidylyltransferase